MNRFRRVSGWLAAVSATVLFGVAIVTLVDGLEWALLSMLGLGLLPIEIAIGLTTLPLLYLVWQFGRAALQAESESASLQG